MMVQRWVGKLISVGSFAILATACASATTGDPAEPGSDSEETAEKNVPIPENVGRTSEALSPAPRQGGCSMGLIHRCQGLCGGSTTVDSCYGNGVGWSTCNCNDGSGWWMQ